MKKLFYVALMGLGLSSAFAQQADRKVEYGLKVGYTNSNARWDLSPQVEKGDATHGYSFGVFAEIPLAEKFSFQPEVLYNETGFKSKGINVKGYLNQKGGFAETKRRNISVPLLAKYYVYEGFNFQLGPQVDFLTNSHLKELWNYPAEGNLPEEFIGQDRNDNDSMSKVNVGAVVGLGYKLPMGVSFNARYNYGLTNFYDKKMKDKIKSDVFSFSVGYQF
ncbi:PorT family protein [Ornithobacterium rhinotracheale]|uniref:porin family protein n=1 Tax=Ornithobacterium rhinotracheale TaxID=28251 RepID=UPI00129C230A|nr:porin family protein [Ornithobacterium rhinotracheale]MRJ10519.1 PorT family protein [Ornithobacterium rhinotracheale]